MLLIVAVGCGGGKYAKEQTILDSVIKAMESFTSAVNSADTPAAVTSALGSFTGTLEKFLPQMKSMATDHADWETNPPEELADTFAKFNAVVKDL